MPRTAAEKTADTVKSNADAATAGAKNIFESVKDTLTGAAGKIEVPAAARDFVAKSAATAKDRAADARVGAEKLTDNAEKFTVAFVGGYANFVRGLLDMTYANVQHTLETVEKVAGAKSVNEAVQIQVDAVRESAKANYERVKDAADTARTTVVDAGKTVQTEMSNLYAKAA